jgi:hypothetical protein
MPPISNIITFSSKPSTLLPPTLTAVPFIINSFDSRPNPDPAPDPILSSSPLLPNPLSSPIRNGEQGWIHTPTRIRVRAYALSGLSQNRIAKQLRKKHATLIS